ncbi:MAG: hypothetical protein JXC36_05965 [Candidatus Atribacteria bacterium]|nr:hypothetical protein [Candidatus Atribacteria bacterium]
MLKDKAIVFCILYLIAFTALAQGKAIKIESFVYSPGLIVNGVDATFYNNAELDLSLCNKVRLNLVHGLFSTSAGEYQQYGGNLFESRTGVTQSVNFKIIPIKYKAFSLNTGFGFTYMYLKEFRTYIQKHSEVVVNGEEVILPFQYFNVYKFSKLGINCFIGCEYLISNSFSVGLKANALNFRSAEKIDLGYLSTHLTLTYYLK